jgi:hypothetical protein
VGERYGSAAIGVLTVVLVLPLLEDPASRLCPVFFGENPSPTQNPIRIRKRSPSPAKATTSAFTSFTSFFPRPPVLLVLVSLQSSSLSSP